MILHKHELGKKELTRVLEGMPSVPLSTDIWMSMATKAYITLSVHYVSTNWEMMYFILETKEFPKSHTGAAISEYGTCR